MTEATSEKLIELRKRVLEKEFSRMNNMQKQAVFSIDGPLLILAGAGSGKTTVLVNRIANIVRYGRAYASSKTDNISSEDADAMERYLESDTPLPEEVRNRLAVSPCRPWQIIAITFTNKAAGELK